MREILIVLHVFLVILLMAVVLVQQPRGGGLGAFFGGSAQDLLGVRGAPTFFQKITWILGGIIGTMAILIAILSKEGTLKASPQQRREVINQIVPLFPEQGTEQQEAPSFLPLEKETQEPKKEEKNK
jgi:preprotein translocase subunit SecG